MRQRDQSYRSISYYPRAEKTITRAMVAMPKALVERLCRHFKAEFGIKVDYQLRGARTGADVKAELESKWPSEFSSIIL